MKLSDIFRISLRNGLSNRNKNILIFLILFTIETIILVFLLTGINININLRKTYKNEISKEGIEITCSSNTGITNGTLNDIYYSTNQKYVTELSYNTVITYLYFDSNNKNEFDLDTDILDNNPFLYLNKEFEDSYSIGDTYSTSSGDFIVKGFIESSKYDGIASLKYLVSIAKITMLEINYTWNENDNLDSVYKFYNDYIKDLKIIFPDDPFFTGVKCHVIESFNAAKSVSVKLICLVSVIAILLFILSVGTIVNSITSTIDDNLYQIGIYKSCGIEDKDLFKIIFFEIFMNLTLAIILAALFTICISSVISKFVLKLEDTIAFLVLDGKIPSFSNKFYFIPYVPILVLAISFLIIVVFSKRSVSKILKADVKKIIDGDVEWYDKKSIIFKQ